LSPGATPFLEPQFLFYGGKGGAGKTTCAAARAVIEAVAGARVLVVSTDPAHSLGDALAVRLSYSPRAVHRTSSRRYGRWRGSLHAIELDARRAFGRWLARQRSALGDVIEHGTWLDRTDIDALLDLPLPGIDELLGLAEIARLARIEPDVSSPRLHASASLYDLIIVDTAPTGHTLRLLASPETVAAVATALDGLQAEHRIVRDRLARRARPEASDEVIAMLAGQARRIAEVLRDESRTTFHWVTLPEPLSLAEACDGIAALEKSRMRIAEVIVNRVLPDAGPCAVCTARRTAERRIVADLSRRLGQRARLRLIPAQLREPRGAAALAGIGRAMMRDAWQEGRPTDSAQGPSRARRRALSLPNGPALSLPRKPALSLPQDVGAVAVESLAPFRDATLLFIAGKGGVGKTTIATAAALRLARTHPGRRTLLLSTDPAHSLSDVLGVPADSVGDDPSVLPRGPSNLALRELDAVRTLAARREALERALDEIAASFGAAAVRHHGAGLMRLVPPGIDELFGILSVVEARDSFPLIVVDMAPTGHALRLLEQPAAAREWVQALLRVLLKYRSLARPGRLARELVALSKSIRDLQSLLSDPSRTRVVVVTRAADLPRLETERLMSDLRRLEMAIPAIVVNALTLGPGRCARCRAIAAAERRQVDTLRRGLARSRQCVIIQTPLSAPPPRGLAALERWAARWTCDQLPARVPRRRGGRRT
jgi:arsenite/tail-anchored protein-transporting ATPase